MTPTERYDATLAVVRRRRELAIKAWTNGPDANWFTEDSDRISDLDLVERQFIASHDPTSLLRVYNSTERILLGHHPRGHPCSMPGSYGDIVFIPDGETCAYADQIIEVWLRT